MAAEQGTAPSQPSPSPGPIQPGERIEVIDILRGFAVGGMLTVNMLHFSSPQIYLMMTGTRWWTGTADRIAEGLISFLAAGKFYSLFSLLFGLGLVIQMQRAEARGARFVPLYLRRLTVLLFIGAAHAVLLWSGDILMAYAVLGFLLLLLRKRAQVTLLIVAAICLLLPVVMMAGLMTLQELARHSTAATQQMQEYMAKSADTQRAMLDAAVRAYSRNGYLELLPQRALDLAISYASGPFWIPNVFAMFLVGMYVGRRGLLRDVPAHLTFFRRTLWVGLVLGLIGNALPIVANLASARLSTSVRGLLPVVGFAVGAPSLCFFYASALVLLAQRSAWRKRMASLAAVGRMALSNYLFHSLLCTTLFYGYGFGLYGKVGPALCLAIAVAIYSFQLVVSPLWLRHFRFGPVEWLWRSLTYGKLQPMRVIREVALA